MRRVFGSLVICSSVLSSLDSVHWDLVHPNENEIMNSINQVLWLKVFPITQLRVLILIVCL